MSIEVLLKILAMIACEKADGHYTIMKFTTGWRVMIGTPDLDGGSGREQVELAPHGETLEAAIISTINRAMKEK